MNRRVYSSVVCAAALLGALAVPFALGQPSVAPGGAQETLSRPCQPSGHFGDLGRYLTIEGVRAEGVKIEHGTLLVDTVNGKKLDQPVSVVVRACAFDSTRYDLPTDFVLPPKQRCVFKGFESGGMIGVPSAVENAAKELGRVDLPMSPTHWRWRPYFVALIVVEPKGVELIPKR
ncbi:MAG: hypothetical protein U0941_10820 [Planctomycetaceae bacterium]